MTDRSGWLWCDQFDLDSYKKILLGIVLKDCVGHYIFEGLRNVLQNALSLKCMHNHDGNDLHISYFTYDQYSCDYSLAILNRNSKYNK